MSSIKTVAIIGSGNMGSGIAQKSAQENFEIQMVDREEKWVNHGQEIISNLLEQALERRIFNIDQVNAIKEKISGVVGTNNVDPKTDLVIEAVFEDFNVKKDVFTILDQVCNEHTILASNTSSLSVNDLAKSSGRPDRFIGLHFFYHPAKNRLVEIIPAESTTKNTLKAVETYCKTMGKVVIICKDRPGFVVNRFFVPWLNEACILLQEGVATAAQIDSIARDAFNIGMGPFALMNLTGPTIALHATDYLAEQLDTPRYNGAKNLREMVDKGELWKIGDEEYYDETLSITVKERLLGQVFAVAGQIVDEEICSKEDVDRGAKVGLRWDEGPFEIANRIGIKEAYRMAEKYCKLVNFEIPVTLENQFNISEDFIFSYIDVEINDSVAIVRLNRPEAMNALNVKLVTELGDVIDGLNQNNSVNTIVLEGAGKAFVAGADVKFFVDKINEVNAHGHEVLNKIENSPKVTIALTTGLALGGGLELALSCDYRIGTNRTQFRFPETNIGIYPGLGGTQRTTRICGLEIARYAILAGNFLNSETAKAFGLLTHLVDVNDIDKTIDEIINLGKNNDKYLKNSIDESHSIVKFARSFYTDENLYSILNGSDLENFDMSDNQVSKQIKSLSRTAPIALNIASKLLDIANNKDTEFNQGLKQELDNLEHIFSTSDSLEGLSALIEGRRAKYKNS